jgi:hypothetical protein
MAYDDLPGGLVKLLQAIEADDLPRVAASGRGLLALHDALAQVLGAGPPGAAPTPSGVTEADARRIARDTVSAADVSITERVTRLLETFRDFTDREPRVAVRLDALEELSGKVADEVAALHKLVEGMGDRILAQAGLLAKRADGEHRPDPTPASAEPSKPTPDTNTAKSAASSCSPTDEVPTCGTCPAFLTEPESVALGRCSGCRSPGPTQRIEPLSEKPITIGGRLHERRIAVCRLLLTGPRTSQQICDATDIPRGSLSEVMAHCTYFEKVGDRFAPWSITDAGREALAKAGYVGVSEPKLATPETNTPKPETKAPEPEANRLELTPQQRAALQTQVMCEAIQSAGRPLLPDEIARETGLPVDVVVKRLRTNGPQSTPMSPRYFTTSAREPGAYVLTNSGAELAKGGAA